jgi:hypothetical protein
LSPKFRTRIRRYRLTWPTPTTFLLFLRTTCKTQM